MLRVGVNTPTRFGGGEDLAPARRHHPVAVDLMRSGEITSHSGGAGEALVVLADCVGRVAHRPAEIERGE